MVCDEFEELCWLEQDEKDDFNGVGMPTTCPFGLLYYADWTISKTKIYHRKKINNREL